MLTLSADIHPDLDERRIEQGGIDPREVQGKIQLAGTDGRKLYLRLAAERIDRKEAEGRIANLERRAR